METNNDRNIEMENRITRLEVKLDDVIVNHLPHIQKKVDRVQLLLISNLFGLILVLITGLINLLQK